MIDIPKIKEYVRLLDSAKKDQLTQFCLHPVRDALEADRKKNLELLFQIAKKYKVRFLYVGKYEIAGCEDKRDFGNTWPAMWAIAKEVGFPGSCGNSDQYQCMNAEIVFPTDSYGGWDLKYDRQLSKEESDKKKFYKVVEEFRK